MQKRTNINIPDKVILYKKSWGREANDAVLADMTLVQFGTIVAPSVDLRAEIEDLRGQIRTKIIALQVADATTKETFDLVASAVKGSRSFGKNSAFYDSLGYIRQMDKLTGLTRKKKIPVIAPANGDETGSANVA